MIEDLKRERHLLEPPQKRQILYDVFSAKSSIKSSKRSQTKDPTTRQNSYIKRSTAMVVPASAKKRSGALSPPLDLGLQDNGDLLHGLPGEDERKRWIKRLRSNFSSTMSLPVLRSEAEEEPERSHSVAETDHLKLEVRDTDPLLDNDPLLETLSMESDPHLETDDPLLGVEIVQALYPNITPAMLGSRPSTAILGTLLSRISEVREESDSEANFFISSEEDSNPDLSLRGLQLTTTSSFSLSEAETGSLLPENRSLSSKHSDGPDETPEGARTGNIPELDGNRKLTDRVSEGDRPRAESSDSILAWLYQDSDRDSDRSCMYNYLLLSSHCFC